MAAGVVHPDDKVHAAALAQVQQTRLVGLSRDLHNAVPVQIPADQRRHVAQRGIIQPLAADPCGGHHLLASLVVAQQHRGQIVAGNAGPAVQHQIIAPVGDKTGRHRCTAGKAVGRKAHDGSLPEPAFLVHGKQFDLHAAVLLGGHQDQILTAAAGDVLHQILLIGLFQNGIDRAVLVGVHRQIAGALRGEVPHHQLGCGTIL